VRCAKWWRAILCILDRPLPCGSDAGGPAAVADQPLHGWEVGPHDPVDQAAGHQRCGGRGWFRVAHAEPKGAEVRTVLLSSINIKLCPMHDRTDFVVQYVNTFCEHLHCGSVWSFSNYPKVLLSQFSVLRYDIWIPCLCWRQMISFPVLFGC
jgi:hypothetical protein